MAGTNGNGNGNGSAVVGTSTVKQGLAQMLKGGVIVSRLMVVEEVGFLFGIPSGNREIETAHLGLDNLRPVMSDDGGSLSLSSDEIGS